MIIFLEKVTGKLLDVATWRHGFFPLIKGEIIFFLFPQA
jgi:hypothetical protein